MTTFIDAAWATDKDKPLGHQDKAWQFAWGILSKEQQAEFLKQFRNSPVIPSTKDISNTWEGVLKAAEISGAKFPEVVAAQWQLESARGTATSGKHNYFGLKGSGTNVDTKEFLNGNWITINAGFINFPNLQTCVEYLVNRWYKDFGTYKGVNQASNKNECANLLVKEGYATDPNYATKLIQIMDQRLRTPGGNPPPKQNPLPVTYMSQRDNYRDANRTCFSSSCAMLLKFLKPGSIKTDDDYIKVVFNYGDTTEGSTQVAALKHFGLPVIFATNGNRALIQKQINAGKPVPAGFLHHGTPSKPTGGGHWLDIIGYDDKGYWVNDPWGEIDLLTGTYPSTDGAKKHYSYKNFEPRWMVDGPNTGWCILA